MLTRLDLRGRGARGDLPRPERGGEEPLATVTDILARVRAEGDAALVELTERFDGPRLDDLTVPPQRWAEARAGLADDVRAGLEHAAEAIGAFQGSQVTAGSHHEVDGVRIEGRRVPVASAGCYVPGGRAAYPSTVLMTAIPARVAGVERVVLCVPPDPDGAVPAVTLAAAEIAGVDEVFRVGGAQAIGALAYGTGTVDPVDVIVGPGNIYVALAKRVVGGEGTVGVPSSFPGPSEVVVVADASVEPAWAAVDVILQAEHGPGGLAWLVCWDEAVAEAVDAEVAAQVAASPRRADIEATFDGGGYLALVDDLDAALALSDRIAPEHLELLVDGAEAAAARVRNAGAVFAGPWSPASVGDYVAGPSHVLPTDGTARFASALSVDDFTRDIHVVSLDRLALGAVGPHVEALATAEGLFAHADSVRRRRETSP